MTAKTKSGLIRVLLVDDEELFLEITSEALCELGCEVATAQSGEKALERMESEFFEVLVLDVCMPDMDGLQILHRIKEKRPTQQVVMLTGHGSIQVAIDAMKLGAFDFILKTSKTEDLIIAIRRAAERGRLERRNIALEEELHRTIGSGIIVGESDAIKEVHNFIEKAALSDLPVLITGESGTGKELVARAIHSNSDRASNSLVVVDGSTLREELFASELFGHEKGAFTGAIKKKAGLFEVADRGTIFLDEIGELSTTNQGALLRVIEYGTFRPLGSVREMKTNVRIIAATNKDLAKAVETDDFREDLFYRLNGLAIKMPPLRERKGDIELLAKFFLERRNKKTGSNITISRQALDAFEAYYWPGNVRELLYEVELAALFAMEEGKIKDTHLRQKIRMQENAHQEQLRNKHEDNSEAIWQINFTSTDLGLSEFREYCEKRYLLMLLEKFDDNKTKVAKAMGISRSKVYEKLRYFRID